MLLLAFISLGLYYSVSNTFKLRSYIGRYGEFYGTIRIAMGILEKDVALLYSPRIMLPQKEDDKKKSGTSGSQTTQTQTQSEPDESTIIQEDRAIETHYWLTELQKSTGIRESHFLGEKEKISFVTVSHVRIYRETKESIFSKVSYELRDDEHPPSEEYEGFKVLVKLENPNAFSTEDDNDEYMKVYPLLHGVKSIKFTYYEKEKEKWTDKWDNAGRDYRGRFPDAVKLEIEVVGARKLTFEGTYLFRPEVPLDGLRSST